MNKLLEIYCGTKSISKVFDKNGWDTFTVDFNEKFNPDLCCDMLYFKKSMLPKDFRKPDVIWCSPPCQTFSMCGHNYFMGYPTGSKCYIGLALAYKCLEVIWDLRPKYWFIENPRAGLRSVWFMKPLNRYTVTYCQYGFDRMKPTDIWTNVNWDNPRCCKNGDSCHVAAPRGSKNGTQGEKNAEMRGVIPEQLCEEILRLVS